MGSRNSISTDTVTVRRSTHELGLIVALFCVAALTLGFGLLAEEVMEGDTTAFDTHIARFFRPLGTDALIGPAWLHEMGRDVTALGSLVVLGFILAAVVGYLLLIRKRGSAILIIGSVVGGTIISSILKLFFNRPRPDIPGAAQVFTASFPSSHAMLSAVTFLTLGVLMARVVADARLKRYFIGLAVLLTVAVGLSRIYIGVHYATDVLAGWCVGSAWAALCWITAIQLQQRGQVEAPSTREDNKGQASLDPGGSPVIAGADRR